MKLITHTALVAMLLTLPPARAVNKCTSADGRVTYQEESCPPGIEGKAIKIHNDAPLAGGAYGGGAPSAFLSGPVSGPQAEGSGRIYTGPRGGRYTITGSGNKRYIPRK